MSLNRTIEFTAVLRKFVKVTEFKQIEIVTDLIVISPAVEDECPPSYVVYVVRKGDTLWHIARRYRTTVEAILEANPNIDPNNLQIGDKICIPKDIIEPKG
jgi:LysM repeat protein